MGYAVNESGGGQMMRMKDWTNPAANGLLSHNERGVGPIGYVVTMPYVAVGAVSHFPFRQSNLQSPLIAPPSIAYGCRIIRSMFDELPWKKTFLQGCDFSYPSQEAIPSRTGPSCSPVTRQAMPDS